jgi:hypothetical protein
LLAFDMVTIETSKSVTPCGGGARNGVQSAAQAIPDTDDKAIATAS